MQLSCEASLVGESEYKIRVMETGLFLHSSWEVSNLSFRFLTFDMWVLRSVELTLVTQYNGKFQCI